MSIAGEFIGNGIQTYVPLMEIAGNLQIDLSRNADSMKMKLNGFTKLIPVKGLRGNYVRWQPAENARFGRILDWPLNTPRPVGSDNGPAFTTEQFELRRYQDARILDMVSNDVSNLNLQKREITNLAQVMVTNRSRKVCARITDTAQYPASHVKTATALNGVGFIDGGSTADPRIMVTIQEAKAIIQAATFSRFTDSEVGLLMNPNTARKLSRCRELREYVSNMAQSLGMLTLKPKEFNGGYGLLPILYDTQVIVLDHMYTEDPVNKGGTEAEAGSYVFPDNQMILFVRQGDLVGEEGAENQDWSTFTQFVYDKGDMVAQAVTNEWEQRQFFGMIDFFDTQVTSPITAVVITNLFS